MLSFLVLLHSAPDSLRNLYFADTFKGSEPAFCNATLKYLGREVAIFTSGHFYQGWIRLVPVMLIGNCADSNGDLAKEFDTGMVAHGLGDGLVSFLYFFKHL